MLVIMTEFVVTVPDNVEIINNWDYCRLCYEMSPLVGKIKQNRYKIIISLIVIFQLVIYFTIARRCIYNDYMFDIDCNIIGLILVIIIGCEWLIYVGYITFPRTRNASIV
jgi:hypothetical protein